MTLTGLLAGCVGTFGPGSSADLNNPPKIVRDTNNNNLPIWDRPGAFGPVPAEKQAQGNATCTAADPDLYAAGYNKLAKREDGSLFPDGGFLCLKKEDKK